MEHTLSDDTIHRIKYSNIIILLLQLATTVIYLHLACKDLNISMNLNIQLGSKKTYTLPSKNSYKNSYKSMSFFATKLYL